MECVPLATLLVGDEDVWSEFSTFANSNLSLAGCGWFPFPGVTSGLSSLQTSAKLSSASALECSYQLSFVPRQFYFSLIFSEYLSIRSSGFHVQFPISSTYARHLLVGRPSGRFLPVNTSQ